MVHRIAFSVIRWRCGIWQVGCPCYIGVQETSSFLQAPMYPAVSTHAVFTTTNNVPPSYPSNPFYETHHPAEYHQSKPRTLPSL